MDDSILVRKVSELRSAKGSLAKADILRRYSEDEDFKKFLYYALNPMLTYKVSESSLAAIQENVPLPMPQDTIFDLCEYLSGKSGVSRDDLYRAAAFLHSLEEPVCEVYTSLLSKTLRLGVTNTSVNKIIPGLIPEWEVQQAYPIEKYPLKENVWFSVTQKLNGVRATYYQGKIYARTGQEYKGLDHILAEIRSSVPDGIVLDGELTLSPVHRTGISDNEAFRIATGLINSENADKTGICYTVFDCLPDDDFAAGISKATYSERRMVLDSINTKLLKCSVNHSVVERDGHCIHIHRNVTVLPVLYQGTDQSKIPELLDRMVREDKEGLMVNLDVPYKCKRHNGILKVKRFYTMDLPIIRCEEGSGRLAGTLGAFVLDFKGNEVNVGTGFSDEQRKEFWSSREELPGTLCEVKYKEISSDKNTGAESLQFPVYVSLRTDKREVSYG